MSDVLNPVDVEQKIAELANRIANGVAEVSRRHEAKLTADRIYDNAFAVAFLTYEGPANAKRYAAEKNTQRERLDRDVAEVAYQRAQRTMRGLEGELSAYQSIIRSVIAMYGAVRS